MPIYFSDLQPLMMRAVEALDRGEHIGFEQLRTRVGRGELGEVLQEAGQYPMPAIPATDWQELGDRIDEVLDVNRGDEGEHFYVARNGYCLLIAALWEVHRLHSQDLHRHSPSD
jgi:hypothetical protein